MGTQKVILTGCHYQSHQMDAETRREIFRLRREGRTIIDIATQMGLGRDYVKRVAQERLSTIEIAGLLRGWHVNATGVI